MFTFISREHKPFNTGYLPEEDGHLVYFHEFGNPNGLPILSFHGGPGSFSKPKHANAFNLNVCRIIMFDQRGRGKSLPTGKLEENTTQHTVHDAKRLLDKLNIDHAVIYGCSWGATLALVFAETYPALVNKIIITQAFLARRVDIDWIAHDSGRFYPDLMENVTSNLPKNTNAQQYYAALALSGDKQQCISALNKYGSYEHELGSLSPEISQNEPSGAHLDNFRIRMHYEKENFFLCDNQILDNIDIIKDKHTLIVHNRLDFVCPPEQAWALHKAMNNSKLFIVPDYGHGSPLQDKLLKLEISRFIKL